MEILLEALRSNHWPHQQWAWWILARKSVVLAAATLIASLLPSAAPANMGSLSPAQGCLGSPPSLWERHWKPLDSRST
jgi:hypothetical protein